MIQEAEADGLHASTVNTWICDVQISMGISCFFLGHWLGRNRSMPFTNVTGPDRTERSS